MKIATGWILALGLVATAAFSQDAKEEKKAEAPKRISAAEAKDHMNESVTVTGKVAQVSITSRIVYLNLDKKYPESPFAAVIFNDKTNEFSGLEMLNGKQIELTGKVTEYRDRPQMVLTNSSQIQVVEKAEAAAKK